MEYSPRSKKLQSGVIACVHRSRCYHGQTCQVKRTPGVNTRECMWCWPDSDAWAAGEVEATAQPHLIFASSNIYSTPFRGTKVACPSDFFLGSGLYSRCQDELQGVKGFQKGSANQLDREGVRALTLGTKVFFFLCHSVFRWTRVGSFLAWYPFQSSTSVHNIKQTIDTIHTNERQYKSANSKSIPSRDNNLAISHYSG